MEKEGICAFCGEVAILRESHVLPAFAYRWLRRRSGTGHIRQTDDPNRRVQDGLKLRWLCNACEGRFSRFETAFATGMFYPWHDGNHCVAYDERLLKFCVSVSWRVLKFARGRNKGHSYTPEQEALLVRAEARWRAFLNGEVPHPGEFEQHLLIFDIVESTNIADLPHNFNRFMTGAITLDMVGSNRSLMTFAKMGEFMIFGLIQKGSHKWEGTKVHVQHGELKPGKFTVPAGLLDLFKEKANRAAMAMDGISHSQATKIDNHIVQHIDSFVASDQFRSIVADAEMFGDQAVIRKG
jgi:hypothetical protein